MDNQNTVVENERIVKLKTIKMVIYKNVMVKMVVLIALVLIFELQHFLTVTKVNQNLVKHFNKVFHHSIETKVVDLN